MSTDDNEPPIKEVGSERGEIDAIEAADDVLHWNVITPGAECRCCGRFARPRVVKKYPNGKPHPRPYRHFTCECGRHWKTTIPSNQLARKPAQVGR
jgi:hypothetical protein